MERQKTIEELKNELEEARYQLEEANELIEAIRSGDVDALLIKSNDGHQLYTLENADITYRFFIEQMNEGAALLNADRTIQYCNSRFAEWVGIPLEKVIGKDFTQLVSADDSLRCISLLDDARFNNTKGELTLKGQRSVEMPVSVSLAMLSTKDAPSLSLILTDLTEQKEAQRLLKHQNALLEEAQAETQRLNADLEQKVADRTKELYENQQRLALMLETMAEGVGITDANGKMTYANPMAQRILGLKQSTILERTYDDPQWQNLRLDGSPLPSHEHPMAIMLTTGQPVYDFEIGVQPPDQDRFYISINAAPVKDEDGNIVAGIGTFMDVTNRRKAIQQKDEFISVASHELRTPITSLKASLQLLQRMKDNPNPKMLPVLIEQSNKSLNKVSVLINDLLNATKLTEGQLLLDKSVFQIGDLVKNCCHHIRIDGVYELQTNGDDDLKVYADAGKIDQVLDNFVNNAVKYAPNSKKIQIGYQKVDDMVKVSVTDFGMGIPPEKLPYLFERYYRVDTGGHQYSGLGLGLYICSEIIKKHDGQIGATSEMGKGSTFWFTLPFAG
ncbi:ATP-binding protein [Mucilaginibacter sp. CSA2-8R]|uniref:ATP-binding protein n=1 Tax=Mucilaginibacter sp. CSA2-8R TaxID=3141542 RepID=UPI00315C9FEA